LSGRFSLFLLLHWVRRFLARCFLCSMTGSVLQGFMKSMGVIFASEIGDKTFFVAAIMAMRHPRLLVRSSPWRGASGGSPPPRPMSDVRLCTLLKGNGLVMLLDEHMHTCCFALSSFAALLSRCFSPPLEGLSGIPRS
jgi:hypothetical protein